MSAPTSFPSSRTRSRDKLDEGAQIPKPTKKVKLEPVKPKAIPPPPRPSKKANPSPKKKTASPVKVKSPVKQPTPVEEELEHGSSQEEESENEDEQRGGQISADVEARLDSLLSMVSSLSKTYLKDVQRALGCWGGGSNRDMAEGIVEDLERSARNGSDLREEEREIKRVHKSCWGGCCGDSTDEGSDGSY